MEEEFPSDMRVAKILDVTEHPRYEATWKSRLKFQ
jgi:hypothetical protein